MEVQPDQPPEPRTIVEVRWNDGQTYVGKVLYNRLHTTIGVRFDCGRMKDFDRRKVYALSEQLPDDVKKRLVVMESAPERPIFAEFESIMAGNVVESDPDEKPYSFRKRTRLDDTTDDARSEAEDAVGSSRKSKAKSAELLSRREKAGTAESSISNLSALIKAAMSKRSHAQSDAEETDYDPDDNEEDLDPDFVLNTHDEVAPGTHRRRAQNKHVSTRTDEPTIDSNAISELVCRLSAKSTLSETEVRTIFEQLKGQSGGSGSASALEIPKMEADVTKKHSTMSIRTRFSNRYACRRENCTLVFSREGSRNQHEHFLHPTLDPSGELSIACRFCFKLFRSDFHGKHETRCRRTPPVRLYEFKGARNCSFCPTCGLAFRIGVALAKHSRACVSRLLEPDSLLDYRSPSPSHGFSSKCNKCAYNFVHDSIRRLHEEKCRSRRDVGEVNPFRVQRASSQRNQLANLYSCSHCPLVFKNKRLKSFHQYLLHTTRGAGGEDCRACPHCFKLFRHNELGDHITACRLTGTVTNARLVNGRLLKTEYCKICGLPLSVMRKWLEIHIRNCENTVKNKNELNERICRPDHFLSYSCTICNYPFPAETIKDKHEKACASFRTEYNNQVLPQNLSASVDDLQSQNKNSEQVEFSQIKNNGPIDDCSEVTQYKIDSVFPGPFFLRRNVPFAFNSQQTAAYQCLASDDCQLLFSCSTTRDIHSYLMHTHSDSNGNPALACPVCMKLFPKDDLNLHRQQVSACFSKKRCNTCGISIKSNFAKHAQSCKLLLLKVSKSDPDVKLITCKCYDKTQKFCTLFTKCICVCSVYKCIKCGYLFPNRSVLKLHYKQCDGSLFLTESYPCRGNECNKVFTELYVRDFHEHSLHTWLTDAQSEVVSCVRCLKAFESDKLRQHNEKCTGRQLPMDTRVFPLPMFSCKYCGYSLLSNNFLDIHEKSCAVLVKTNDSNNININRSFGLATKCFLCGYEFFHSYVRRYHERFCNASFCTDEITFTKLIIGHLREIQPRRTSNKDVSFDESLKPLTDADISEVDDHVPTEKSEDTLAELLKPAVKLAERKLVRRMCGRFGEPTRSVSPPEPLLNREQSQARSGRIIKLKDFIRSSKNDSLRTLSDKQVEVQKLYRSMCGKPKRPIQEECVERVEKRLKLDDSKQPVLTTKVVVNGCEFTANKTTVGAVTIADATGQPPSNELLLLVFRHLRKENPEFMRPQIIKPTTQAPKLIQSSVKVQSDSRVVQKPGPFINARQKYSSDFNLSTKPTSQDKIQYKDYVQFPIKSEVLHKYGTSTSAQSTSIPPPLPPPFSTYLNLPLFDPTVPPPTLISKSVHHTQGLREALLPTPSQPPQLQPLSLSNSRLYHPEIGILQSTIAKSRPFMHIKSLPLPPDFDSPPRSYRAPILPSVIKDVLPMPPSIPQHEIFDEENYDLDAAPQSPTLSCSPSSVCDGLPCESPNKPFYAETLLPQFDQIKPDEQTLSISLSPKIIPLAESDELYVQDEEEYNPEQIPVLKPTYSVNVADVDDFEQSDKAKTEVSTADKLNAETSEDDENEAERIPDQRSLAYFLKHVQNKYSEIENNKSIDLTKNGDNRESSEFRNRDVYPQKSIFWTESQTRPYHRFKSHYENSNRYGYNHLPYQKQYRYDRNLRQSTFFRPKQRPPQWHNSYSSDPFYNSNMLHQPPVATDGYFDSSDTQYEPEISFPSETYSYSSLPDSSTMSERSSFAPSCNDLSAPDLITGLFSTCGRWT